MKQSRAERIRRLWDRAEEDFPDKSTEFLMEIACSYAEHEGLRIDHGDVAQAIYQTRNHFSPPPVPPEGEGKL